MPYMHRRLNHIEAHVQQQVGVTVVPFEEKRAQLLRDIEWAFRGQQPPEPPRHRHNHRKIYFGRDSEL